MRLAVLGEGYASATTAFVSGNEIAAQAARDLCADLIGFGGMAGDDATATDFAASYDEAAAEAAAGVAEVACALASLAELSAHSLTNHHAAEVASGGSGVGGEPDASGVVRLMAATPPSALGADADFLPGWAGVVLDFLEGAVWPDADTDRLRAAATTWRTAARAVGLLGAHCETALSGLDDEVSPEIPVAIATTRDLRDRVATVAEQLVAIAGACEAYADQVEAKRAEMLDLLKELGIELGVGAVIAGALSFLSAGLAAGAGSAAAGGRIATASRELKVIADALRILNGSTAATLRPVAVTVRDTRSSLARLLRVDLARADERGVASLGRWPDGWLSQHEKGELAHTIRRHVAKSDRELIERVTASAGPRRASSFADQRTAERFLRRLLGSQSDDIRVWLRTNPEDRFVLTQDFGVIVGRTATRAGEVFDVSGLRAILTADPTMPQGYRIVTAYPA
ncbi:MULTISPECIES: RNase A-like domain-containing protein [unclassified Nocardioides]|uniref:RNase A-like domain-containing protein n=1 Tax=unclassified Nocardioides TaxID=2615069 RepID=UPI0000570086|nr:MULTISPECIES: RNase A-like domain-containing protein [unclassified Nocardioides]ABL83231.1 hypothetical protein Noca_3731 [Nocardioides sp. JS614]